MNALQTPPVPRSSKPPLHLERLVLPPPGGFILEGEPGTGHDELASPSLVRPVVKFIGAIALFCVLVGIGLALLAGIVMPMC